MSWIMIAVIALFAVCGYMGWKKGIVQIVVSIATLVVTLLASAIIAPVVCKGLAASTDIDEGIQEIVYNIMMEDESSSDKTAVNLVPGEEQLSKDIESIEADKDNPLDYAKKLGDNSAEISQYATQLINRLGMADTVKKPMLEFVSEQNIKKTVNNNDIVKIINRTDGSVKSIVVSIAATKLAGIIFSAIVYAVVFIVIFVGVRVLIAATNLITRLPVIRQANKLGGLILGLVEGLIAVWLLFVVITACGSMEWAYSVLTDIESNKVLTFLYDTDIILKLLF